MLVVCCINSKLCIFPNTASYNLVPIDKKHYGEKLERLGLLADLGELVEEVLEERVVWVCLRSLLCLWSELR